MISDRRMSEVNRGTRHVETRPMLLLLLLLGGGGLGGTKASHRGSCQTEPKLPCNGRTRDDGTSAREIRTNKD